MYFQLLDDLAASKLADLRREAEIERLVVPGPTLTSRWAAQLRQRLQQLTARPQISFQLDCQPVCLACQVC